jgi:hypothetical protein
LTLAEILIFDTHLDLERANVVHELNRFCIFLIGKVFIFVLSGPGHAAICCLQTASALTPMAQMKPSSSRPIAVMIFLVIKAFSLS